LSVSSIVSKLEGRQPGVLGQKTTKHSAILLPLVEVNDELSVLFEVRSEHLKSQPGEICFPGGRIDSTDLNAEAAAVRELSEELGVNEDLVEVIAPLDYLVTPFRGVIYPFVGKVEDISKIQPNEAEVAATFTVPLNYLYNQEPKMYEMGITFEPASDFPFHLIPNRKTYNARTQSVQELFYFYEDYVIWGLTARVLNHFLTLTKPT
jgi:peroxisomal coenzyme A diphosphatase NUDT7